MIASLKLMILSDILIGTLVKCFSKSTTHFSKWISPQVPSIISPLGSTEIPTDKSDLLSCFRPSINLWLSSILGVDMLTFSIHCESSTTGANEIQSYLLDSVADLYTSYYKLAMPTMLPG